MKVTPTRYLVLIGNLAALAISTTIPMVVTVLLDQDTITTSTTLIEKLVLELI